MKQRVRVMVSVAWFSVSEIHEDMLRYDIGFANEEFPNVVILPVFKEAGQGKWGGSPTVDRWRSFGIAIKPIEAPQDLADVRDNSTKWYTIRHANRGDDDLKVTLMEYMNPATDRKWH